MYSVQRNKEIWFLNYKQKALHPQVNFINLQFIQFRTCLCAEVRFENRNQEKNIRRL